MSTKPQSYSSFRFQRQEHIASLQLDVQLFEHIKTGAIHIHLDTQQEENVFLVAFRTMPMDSTGVAHILEHTSLCGSKKYPVRDPFFMMIRRSLNTFMNAFTSSDWTAYPFASQNRKDFFNLLDVYLDATFFARLDALDFAQEGHRVEFEKQADGSDKLVFKGVVFNEMKGAMSSPVSQLWQNVSKYLFPTTTYHYNSGGEPVDIPNLTHEQLLDFYRSHYHPSNAVFMTAGDLNPVELQEKFESHALSQFQRQDMSHLHISDEQRMFSPLRVQEGYPLDEEDTTDKTHHVLAWLLGSSTNLYEQMRANLLSRVLLDNSASPLRQVLETGGIGQAPSPMCGLEDSNREMTFVCGVEGAAEEEGLKFEQMVLTCLQDVVANGVPQDQVTSALHQLELSQREIGGDGYPFGLQLILTAMPAAIHHGDPLAALNLDPVLERLRAEVEDQQFIPNLVQELLLNNAHRLTYSMLPDTLLAQRRDDAEAARLAAMQAAMSDTDKQQVNTLAEELNERQMQVDDASILPQVTREDIPSDTRIPEPHSSTPQNVYYAEGTNGLVYHQLVLPWPELKDDDLRYLSLLAQLYTEVGVGDADYLHTQARQAAVCGNISAFLSKRGAAKDADQMKAYFVLSAKGLQNKHEDIVALLQQTLKDCRFDEAVRIKDLVAQLRARRQQGVVNGGHGLAMTCASQTISATANVGNAMSGLDSVKWLQELDDSLADEASLQALCARLSSLQQQLAKAPLQVVSVAEEEHHAAINQTIENAFARQLGDFDATINWSYEAEQIKQLWTTNSQVNFCARAYATVPSSHPDSAALVILGEMLRNGFLHRAIREQGGAYGGGASQDNNGATFRFYSYRDPRSAETFADYDAAIAWAADGQFTPEHLEEAVLGVIGSLDKPGSPAGEALSAYQNELHDRSPEIRRAYRQRILSVTLDDVQQVVQTYLINKPCHEAVVGPASLEKESYFANFDVNRV